MLHNSFTLFGFFEKIDSKKVSSGSFRPFGRVVSKVAQKECYV